MKKFTLLCIVGLLLNTNLYSQKKVFNFVGETTPPYLIGNGKNVSGFFYDLVNAISKEVGYKCRINLYPPKRNILMANGGECDAIIGAPKDIPLFVEEIYSQSLCKITINPIVLKNSTISYTKIEDLKNITIGCVMGAGFEEAFPTLKLETTIHTENNFHKLMKSRFQVIIEDPNIINYLAENGKDHKQYKDKYKILKPSLFNVELVGGFSKKAKNFQTKINDFNKGINIIKSNGVYESIVKKWKITN